MTMPAGLLLFVCLFLPGYSECDHAQTHTTGSLPWFIGVGVVALLVVVAMWLLAGRVGEMFAAIAAIVASGVGLVMTAFYILCTSALVGIYLTSAAALALLCGSIVWVVEASEHEREPRRAGAIRDLGVGILALYVVIALVAPHEVTPPGQFRPELLYPR